MFFLKLGVYRRLQEMASSGFLFLVPALSFFVSATRVLLFFDEDRFLSFPGPLYLLFLVLGKCLFSIFPRLPPPHQLFRVLINVTSTERPSLTTLSLPFPLILFPLTLINFCTTCHYLKLSDILIYLSLICLLFQHRSSRNFAYSLLFSQLLA